MLLFLVGVNLKPLYITPKLTNIQRNKYFDVRIHLNIAVFYKQLLQIYISSEAIDKL